MMRVVVVGGSGFLGRTLVRRLIAAGHEVTVYGRNTERPVTLPGSVVWRSTTAWNGPPTLEPCDALLYLAQSAEYRRIAERFDDVLHVNVTLAVQAAIAATAVGCRWYFYASTGNVYEPSFAPHREDDPLDRSQGYALSKITAEESLPHVVGNMSVTIARIFGLYGSGQSSTLVSNVVERVRHGIPVSLQPGPGGDFGGLRVSFCHVDDAASMLLRLLDRARTDAALPKVLNMAGPQGVSIRELAEVVGNLLDKEPQFTQADVPRKCDLLADISLLRSLMPCDFHSLEAGLRETLRMA